MKLDLDQLKNFLVDSGLIARPALEKAEQAAAQQGAGLTEYLVANQVIDEERLGKVKAYLLGIPFIGLEHESIPPAVLALIPEPIAHANNVVAYRRTAADLEVGMLDPEDLQTLDFLKKKTGLNIKPRLTSRASIAEALKQYQKSLKAEFGELVDESGEPLVIKTETAPAGVEDDEAHLATLKKRAAELPVIRIVDTLLKHAILEGASDIHIEPTEAAVVSRYRVDGILHDAMTLPKEAAAGIVARVKVLANLKLDEHRLPQDGRFKIQTEDHWVSFRVSVLPVYDGEKIVMRVLHEGGKTLTLEELGFAGQSLAQVKQSITKPNGLILVTGPTGSGKTTTLYALLNILNTPDVNISTVEDPIEYRMPRVNQTQVRPNIGLTFAAGLRTLVRQDPDIIMVGEIRDSETASLAIQAALTGHLVLSTLHTNSAAGTLPRLLDMKVEEFLLASTANIIIAQRLVRRLCPDSREEHYLSRAEVEALGKQIDLARMLSVLKAAKAVGEAAQWPKVPFYRPVKSAACPDGYKGRIGIYEVLPVTAAIRELINRRATMDAIEAKARAEGMLTLREDGFLKAARGLTSLEAVLEETKE